MTTFTTTSTPPQAIATCSCGCNVLKIEKDNWLDGTIDYCILLYKEEFHTRQETPLKMFLTRLKHAWFTLIGKEYLLFDLYLNEKDFETFKENINKL